MNRTGQLVLYPIEHKQRSLIPSLTSSHFAAALCNKNTSVLALVHRYTEARGQPTIEDRILIRFQLPGRSLRMRRHPRHLLYRSVRITTGLVSPPPATFYIRLLHQPPADQGVVDERLEDGHERFFIVSEDLHGDFAGITEVTFDAAYLWKREQSAHHHIRG